MTTDEQKTTALSKSNNDISPAMREVMAKYGVIPEDIGVAPVPQIVGKVNLDELCVLDTQVRDPQDDSVIKCDTHSGPLVYLKTGDPISGNKYEETVGFMVYTIWHPTKGELVFTHGIPKDGPTELSRFISTLNPGNYFQVGSFPTSSGKRLFKPIPVQD